MDKILGQKKLKDRLEKDKTFKGNLKETMEQTDPTPNNKYVRWIVDSYINGGIKKFEDMLSRVKPSLEKYIFLSKTKKLNKGLQKWENEYNIDNYCGISGCKKKGFEKPGLEDLLENYQNIESPQDDQRGDFIEYCNNDDVRVIIPQDKKSSCYYGRGTRWCTAAKNNNMFDEYNSEGFLYIVLPKKPQYEGEKYQLHFETESFMDERDEDIDLDNLLYDYKGLYDCLKNIVELYMLVQNPAKLKEINPSQDLIRYVLRRNGFALQFVDNPSYDLQLIAIKNEGLAIQFVKNPSDEMKMEAVKQDGMALEFLKNPTYEMQKEAVKEDGFAIQYVKDQTLELQRLAVEQDEGSIIHIKDPSSEIRQIALDKVLGI